MLRVLNSMAAGRRLARRAIGLQALVALLLVAAFALDSWRAAAAAGVGGGAVVLGSALLASRALAGQAPPAGLALGRLFAGVILKWIVILGALYLALARFGLPPLPLLAGMAGTTVAFLLIGKFKA